MQLDLALVPRDVKGLETEHDPAFSSPGDFSRFTIFSRIPKGRWHIVPAGEQGKGGPWLTSQPALGVER